MTDQRGSGDARNSGGKVDICAYEIQLSEPLVVTTLANELDVSSDPRLGTGTSLREALAWANQNPGAGSISFASGLTGTIALTREALTITDSTDIQGPGAIVLTIDGNRTHQIFLVNDSQAAIRTVTISGLMLTRGRTVAVGAIQNRENLTLSRVVITDNQATVSEGCNFSDNATLTLFDSSIANSVAISGVGIDAFGGSVSITGSTVSGNRSKAGFGLIPDGGGASYFFATFVS